MRFGLFREISSEVIFDLKERDSLLKSESWQVCIYMTLQDDQQSLIPEDKLSYVFMPLFQRKTIL